MIIPDPKSKIVSVIKKGQKIPVIVDDVRYNIGKNKKITIFERNPLSCPLYLLFLIFGSYYAAIVNPDDKNNFTFYRDIMIAFENSMLTPNNNNPKLFKQIVSKKYFPRAKLS